MTEQSGGSNEMVRRALAAAVSDYGERALSNPQVLRNVFDDYLPDAPRLVDVLTTAAEDGVAQTLSQHLGRHMDIATAIRLTTSTLQDHRALDPAASTWAVTEFARALGHKVADVPPPGAPGDRPAGTYGQQPTIGPGQPGFGPSVFEQPTIGAGGVAGPGPGYQQPPWGQGPGPGPGGPGQPPSYPPQQPPPSYPPQQGPPSYQPQGPPSYQPPQGPPSYQPPPPLQWGPTAGGGPSQPPGSQPPGGPPPGYTQPQWGTPGPGGPGGSGGAKKRNPALFGVGGVLALVIVYFAVAAGAKLPPFGSPGTTTTTSTTSTTVARTTTTPPSTTVPGGPRPLRQVLPRGVSNCRSFTGLPEGLGTASSNLTCDDVALGTGAEIFGYQFDTTGEYEAALIAYNSVKNFDQSTAGKGCPPTTSSNEGQDTWHDGNGNTGLLECLTFGGSGKPINPVYIWTIPRDHVILEAIGPDGSTFAALDAWWLTEAHT